MSVVALNKGNRHPVDELADVRAEMRVLKEREYELRRQTWRLWCRERELLDARCDWQEDDDLLIALMEAEDGGLSISTMAMVSRWFDKKDKPDKSRAQRVLKRLKEEGLVEIEHSHYELTNAGKEAAQRAKARRPHGCIGGTTATT